MVDINPELAALSRLELQKLTDLDDLRSQRQLDGLTLTPKQYQGYDADNGQLILKGPDGQANVSSQGTGLSNAAIQTGSAVSSYAWQNADWKPTVSRVGGELIAQDENIGDWYDQEQGGNPEGVPEDTPPMTAPEDQPPYCECKVLWVRGVPDREQKAPIPPTFTGGQCDGTSYTLTVELQEVPILTGVPGPVITLNPVVTGAVSGIEVHEPDPGQTGNRGGVYILHNGGPTRIKDYPLSGAGGLTVINEVITNAAGSPDDCGDLPTLGGPETGPPAETDPGTWYKVVLSCNLPLTATKYEVDGKTQVIAFDASGERARLGYDENIRVDVLIRCKEEGPP